MRIDKTGETYINWFGRLLLPLVLASLSTVQIGAALAERGTGSRRVALEEQIDST
jgi:hypothetical protein